MNTSLLEILSSWSNGIAVTLGIITAIVTALALIFSTKLNVIKDAELKRFQQESNEKISVAKSEAAKANEHAAEANKQAAEANERAAEANQKAEEERLARVKIEKQLAPRTLTESEVEEVSKNLQSFASSFKGRRIKVSSYSQDAEGIVFALMINEILFRAGIETEPVIGRLIPIGIVDIGVKITGPTEDGYFIKALISEIYSHRKTRIFADWRDEFKELIIHVGVKPVAGLPDVVDPNKPRQQ